MRPIGTHSHTRAPPPGQTDGHEEPRGPLTRAVRLLGGKKQRGRYCTPKPPGWLGGAPSSGRRGRQAPRPARTACLPCRPGTRGQRPCRATKQWVHRGEMMRAGGEGWEGRAGSQRKRGGKGRAHYTTVALPMGEWGGWGKGRQPLDGLQLRPANAGSSRGAASWVRSWDAGCGVQGGGGGGCVCCASEWAAAAEAPFAFLPPPATPPASARRQPLVTAGDGQCATLPRLGGRRERGRGGGLGEARRLPQRCPCLPLSHVETPSPRRHRPATDIACGVQSKGFGRQHNHLPPLSSCLRWVTPFPPPLTPTPLSRAFSSGAGCCPCVVGLSPNSSGQPGRWVSFMD